MNGNFYFAYGSNMNPDQMAARCPEARPVGVAVLEGWNVAINSRGVATIVPDEAGSIVEGVLWSVSEVCLQSLDRYEGVKNGHYVRETFELRLNHSLVLAIVYVASSSDLGEPRAGYLEGILHGADHFGISRAYRARLTALSGCENDEAGALAQSSSTTNGIPGDGSHYPIEDIDAPQTRSRGSQPRPLAMASEKVVTSSHRREQTSQPGETTPSLAFRHTGPVGCRPTWAASAERPL
jgi:gamma-glutamylcyclotransferase (GGCT)/AIG2-like uncharacterized protein YtfP